MSGDAKEKMPVEKINDVIGRVTREAAHKLIELTSSDIRIVMVAVNASAEEPEVAIGVYELRPDEVVSLLEAIQVMIAANAVTTEVTVMGKVVGSYDGKPH